MGFTKDQPIDSWSSGRCLFVLIVHDGLNEVERKLSRATGMDQKRIVWPKSSCWQDLRPFTIYKVSELGSELRCYNIWSLHQGGWHTTYSSCMVYIICGESDAFHAPQPSPSLLTGTHTVEETCDIKRFCTVLQLDCTFWFYFNFLAEGCMLRISGGWDVISLYQLVPRKHPVPIKINTVSGRLRAPQKAGEWFISKEAPGHPCSAYSYIGLFLCLFTGQMMPESSYSAVWVGHHNRSWGQGKPLTAIGHGCLKIFCLVMEGYLFIMHL